MQLYTVDYPNNKQRLTKYNKKEMSTVQLTFDLKTRSSNLPSAVAIHI